MRSAFLHNLAWRVELNKSVIFICAMETASVCIPMREIATINVGLKYIKVKEQIAIFISLFIDYSNIVLGLIVKGQSQCSAQIRH